MGLLNRRLALLGTIAIASVYLAGSLRAATASPLFVRSYTVIPDPQKVTLTGKDFEFAASWRPEGEIVDVKDHQPVRTVDMSYLIYRELLYPMGASTDQVISIRNQYAQEHQMPARNDHLEWKDSKSGVSAGRTPDEDDD